ncbi:DUF3237 domain-containing protein [Microbacterium sp. MYb64]|uniref:DUF3237 domain-containing protein n=1 Tax=Microbacterium sp. MYb64 TaxID=1848691 RepID=UPI000CFDA600|nr:DUF3237 domain-containing protein [Microbacterium sp. MYb64]PRB06941.1 hypothetical protein CQ044_07615 [Microbacterium sp. MYb64]
MSDLFAELPEPRLEPAFEVTVQVGPPRDHGITSAGHRRVVPILGGRITGSLEAEILAGGSDRQLIASDGTIGIDAEYSAVAAAGPLLIRTRGVRRGAAEVLARLGRGQPVDPGAYYFRTTFEVEAAAPEFAELQGTLFVAVCRRDGSEVRYRVHRIV